MKGNQRQREALAALPAYLSKSDIGYTALVMIFRD